VKKAVERLAQCSTGKLVWDPDVKLLVPELKPECAAGQQQR
jgi:hypothetical protein